MIVFIPRCRFLGRLLAHLRTLFPKLLVFSGADSPHVSHVVIAVLAEKGNNSTCVDFDICSLETFSKTETVLKMKTTICGAEVTAPRMRSMSCYSDVKWKTNFVRKKEKSTHVKKRGEISFPSCISMWRLCLDRRIWAAAAASSPPPHTQNIIWSLWKCFNGVDWFNEQKPLSEVSCQSAGAIVEIDSVAKFHCTFPQFAVSRLKEDFSVAVPCYRFICEDFSRLVSLSLSGVRFSH